MVVVLVLLTMQSMLLLIPSQLQPKLAPRRPGCDDDLCGVDWTHCDGKCCELLEVVTARVSLIVVTSRTTQPSEDALASWRAVRGLDELVVVQWGPCTHIFPREDGLVRERLICTSHETTVQMGRALNLAAQVASARVLLVASPWTVLAADAVEVSQQGAKLGTCSRPIAHGPCDMD